LAIEAKTQKEQKRNALSGYSCRIKIGHRQIVWKDSGLHNQRKKIGVTELILCQSKTLKKQLQ